MKQNRFTVMFAFVTDRTKLPPYVVFKGVKLPTGVLVRCEAKGEPMRDWVDTVWDNRSGSPTKCDNSILILDAFPCLRKRTSYNT